MASNYIETSEEQLHNPHEHHHYCNPNNQSPTPKSFNRQWSSNSSDGSSEQPKCVCAPATHANSFKCRLHRSTSHGHAAGPPQPPMKRSASHSVASRTVEAL